MLQVLLTQTTSILNFYLLLRVFVRGLCAHVCVCVSALECLHADLNQVCVFAHYSRFKNVLLLTQSVQVAKVQ